MLFIALINGLICGAACSMINSSKGEDGGFWWGFIFGELGIIIVLLMNSGSSSSSGHSYGGNSNDGYLPDRFSSDNWSYKPATVSKDNEILNNGGWKCAKCGQVNYVYEGTCKCGNTKAANNSLTIKKKKLEAEKPKVEKVDVERNDVELQNIKKVQSYKELLDSGVITQEEFEKKKKELLKL